MASQFKTTLIYNITRSVVLFTCRQDKNITHIRWIVCENKTCFCFVSGKPQYDLIEACLTELVVLFSKHWLELCYQLAINLENMHDKGILHNDIKTDNIMVEIKPMSVFISLTLARQHFALGVFCILMKVTALMTQMTT